MGPKPSRETADSADACLKQVDTQKIELDLLVTDVIMPGGNGVELFLKLKDRMQNLKCLFMSGYSADVISDYGQLEMGAHFISKPFNIKDFSIKVREILDDFHAISQGLDR